MGIQWVVQHKWEHQLLNIEKILINFKKIRAKVLFAV